MRAASGLVPREPVRVAEAVPALVAGQGDLLGEPQQARMAPGVDARAEIGVRLHKVAFGASEPPWLVQDKVAHADFADIVEPRGGEQQPHLVLGPAEDDREGGGVAPYALGVLARTVASARSR